MANPIITKVQVEGNDVVSFLNGTNYIRSMSQILPQSPTYISYRYDSITISQVAGEAFTFTVYTVTDVGGNSFPVLNFNDPADVVQAKTIEIYRLLVTAIFKGCCECGDTMPECSIQYTSGDSGLVGRFDYTTGLPGIIRFNETTGNNQDFSGFFPLIQDGSWVFIFSKTDPTVYAVLQLSNYQDLGTAVQFDTTELNAAGLPFVTGTEFCIDFTSVGGSLVQGWQDTLDINPNLSHDNTVDGGGYNFVFDNNASFLINSTAGSIETNGTGASLNSGSQQILVTPGYIDIITPGIGGASTGWVLALTASGHVEYVEAGTGTISSIGLYMPPAFTVSTPNPLTSNGDFTVTGAGTALEYIDGTGNLQTFPVYTVENGLHAYGGVPGEAPADPYLFHLGGFLIEDTTITTTNGGNEYALGVAGLVGQDTQQPFGVSNLGNGGLASFQDYGSGPRPNPSVEIVGDVDLIQPLLKLTMEGTLPSSDNTLLRLGYTGTPGLAAMTMDFEFRNNNAVPANSNFISARITNTLTNFTDNNEQSKLGLQLISGGAIANRVEVAGIGQLTLNNYGANSFADGSSNISTVPYVLGVKTDGTVWKTAAGTGTVVSINATGLLTTNPDPITATGTVTSVMNSGFLVGRYSPGTGVFEEVTIGAGLSLSGGTLSADGTVPVYTVINGLHTQESPPDSKVFHLGGDLIETTTIFNQGFDFIIERDDSGVALKVNNTNTSGGISSGAIQAITTDGLAGDFYAGRDYYGANSIQPIIRVNRTTILPPDGEFYYDEIGSSIEFMSPTAVAGFAVVVPPYSSRIASVWSQSRNESGFVIRKPVGRTEIWNYDGNNLESISATFNAGLFSRGPSSGGLNQFNQYGQGNFYNLLPPVYGLAVDQDGYIIEVDLSSGGGGTVISVGATGLLTTTATNPFTVSGTVTSEMNSGFLVGRYSTGLGVFEEIAIGDGLTLTGNTLSADGSVPVYTVNNGLSPDPLDAYNFQLGGPLVQDTTITGGTTPFSHYLHIDNLTGFSLDVNGKGYLIAENGPDKSQFIFTKAYATSKYENSITSELAEIAAGGDSSISEVYASLRAATVFGETGIYAGVIPGTLPYTANMLGVKTPNVANGSATVGQVLTLKSMTGSEAGRVEFETFTPGGTYDANQGIYKNTTLTNDTFQLGYLTSADSLLAGNQFSVDRYVDTGANVFNINGTPVAGNSVIRVVNKSTVNNTSTFGIYASNSNTVARNAYAVFGQGGTVGGGIFGTTNNVLVPINSCSYGGSFGTINADATPSQLLRSPLNVFSTRLGGGVIDHGAQITYTLNNDAGISFFAGGVGFLSTSVTNVGDAETSKFFISTRESGIVLPVTKLEINTVGQLKLNKYTTSTAFSGSSGPSIGILNIDASGNVFAGTGGTSSPLTTKGDIYTFSTTNDRLPVGTNGQMLYADSTAATGLKWDDAPTGGIPFGIATGTDTYTVSAGTASTYTDGDAYLVRFTNGNTGASTLNVNGIGAADMYSNSDGLLIGGDIWAESQMLCVYDSSLPGFKCIGTSTNSLFAYVTNAEATTITKGTAVYAAGGTGDRMTVMKALATADSTSAQTVGIVFADILSGQKGIILIQGELTGLSLFPTSGQPVGQNWSDGDPIYLSSTTAGGVTRTKQYAPSHLVYLGICVKASNGTGGRMYVRIQNGYELDELHNVQAQSPSLNDTLYYDSSVSPGQWKTASIPTILGYTPVATTRTISTTSPLSGGGDLSANRTLSIADAVADGSTKGAAAFTASDFNSAAGVISIDYTNGQAASASNKGFLTAADWTTFNSKASSDTIAFSNFPATTIATGGQTQYFSIMGGVGGNVTEANRQIPMPISGTLKNLYVRNTTAQPASGSYVITVRKNGVSTAMTVTYTNADGTNATKSDTTNTVSVVAGDLICLQCINNASGASMVLNNISILLQL